MSELDLAVQRAKQLKPGFGEIQGAFGSKVRVDERGKFTADISRPKDRQLFLEMYKPYQRAATDAANEQNSRIERVKMRAPNGEVRELEPEVADLAGRGRGFHSLNPVGASGVVAGGLDVRDFCPVCDYRRAWCECGDHGRDDQHLPG